MIKYLPLSQPLATRIKNHKILKFILLSLIVSAIVATVTIYTVLFKFDQYKFDGQYSSTHNWLSQISCPLQNSSSACVHHSVTNTSNFTSLCPKVQLKVGSCDDQSYELIVTTSEHMLSIHGFANKLLVQSTPTTPKELDDFIQKNPKWIVDVFGMSSFEFLIAYDDPQRNQLLELLGQLQSKCERFFYGVINGNGFSSDWHSLGLGLAHTLSHNMTLFPAKKYDAFIPVNNCTQSDMEKSFSINPPETQYSKWDQSTINYKSINHDNPGLTSNGFLILPQYAEKGHFWWRSILTYYATRVNYRTREHIRDTSTVHGPCIAMHVRRSDKTREEAKSIDFSKYMEEAVKYKEKTGVSNIYLMTDDPSVILESEGYTDFQFFHSNTRRTNRGWEYDSKHIQSLEKQMLDFLTEVHSAVYCEHKIVTYSSNVGRLIGELAFVKTNSSPSLVSMDSEWLMSP